ncbi:uncharacterized protein METZ01_LOCUS150606, partial [marine metagenome]
MSQIRTAICLLVVVVSAVVLPITHGVHETVDHDCTLCQLRHSAIGIVSDGPAVVDRFESVTRSQQCVVGPFTSHHQLPAG